MSMKSGADDPHGGNNSAAELKRRAERRKDILDQIADLQVDLKALKAEDKEDGFNEKALAQCIKEMRRGADYQCDQLTLELELDTYRKACGLPVTLEAAQEAALAEAQIVPDTSDGEPVGDMSVKDWAPKGRRH